MVSTPSLFLEKDINEDDDRSSMVAAGIRGHKEANTCCEMIEGMVEEDESSDESECSFKNNTGGEMLDELPVTVSEQKVFVEVTSENGQLRSTQPTVDKNPAILIKGTVKIPASNNEGIKVGERHSLLASRIEHDKNKVVQMKDNTSADPYVSNLHAFKNKDNNHLKEKEKSLSATDLGHASID
ncbi:hypothetical protein L2E82_44760 [Cichorium intybus]|uniref:Uncharacterized protein n=1 Tax=Cichorium intybus TaxID=13427 RepID=A0ACB8ZQQ1_CICIN|nr:hypothetical protein L2E82_44760 [Cichorium intybus]